MTYVLNLTLKVYKVSQCIEDSTAHKGHIGESIFFAYLLSNFFRLAVNN